ncbi:mCG1037155, partial [Mus musculus]
YLWVGVRENPSHGRQLRSTWKTSIPGEDSPWLRRTGDVLGFRGYRSQKDLERSKPVVQHLGTLGTLERWPLKSTTGLNGSPESS